MANPLMDLFSQSGCFPLRDLSSLRPSWLMGHHGRLHDNRLLLGDTAAMVEGRGATHGEWAVAAAAVLRRENICVVPPSQ